MATLVGRESHLPELLQGFLELEHDAIAAYSAAIERLQETSFQLRLEQFRSDHRRHVRDLEAHALRMGAKVPQGVDLKAILTQGKVMIGRLVGDRGILIAMRSNEDDTNVAYERAVARRGVDPELTRLFDECLADERRHRNWIEDQLSSLGEPPKPASEEYLRRR